MQHNILKRCDNPAQIDDAITYFQKQPKNRRNTRILNKLRAKLDKLVPPTPEELAEEAGQS